MKFPRAIGLIDLGILTVVAVALFLPAREMYASPVLGDDFAAAAAEARTIAHPGDGLAVEDFTRRLDEANQKDWAIEASVRASDRAKDAPTRWRALLAASVAYVDHIDVVPALDFANRAVSACDSARDKGDMTACPTFEEIRMQLYQANLKAGVDSGIDPHRDPAGFRRAGASGLREIRLKTHDEPPAPPPGHGSGSAKTP